MKKGTMKSSGLSGAFTSEKVEQAAEKHKLLGNEYMKKKEYQAAVDAYSIGIEECSGCSIVPILFTNRAVAWLKMGQANNSYVDASWAVHLDPKWAKGYYRQAAALVEQSRAEEARICLLCACVLQPTNQDITTALMALPHDKIGVHGAEPQLAISGSILPPLALVLRLWELPPREPSLSTVIGLLSDGPAFIRMFHGGQDHLQAYISANVCEDDQAEAVLRQLFGFYLEDQHAELPLPESVLLYLVANPTAIWDEDTSCFKRLSGVSTTSFRWLSQERMLELAPDEAPDWKEQVIITDDVDQITWQLKMSTCVLPVGSVAQKWGLSSSDPHETCAGMFGVFSQ